MMQKISIEWQDGFSVTVDLLDNPMTQHYLGCLKHLQHLPLNFSPRENPLVSCKMPVADAVNQLQTALHAIGVGVDLNRVHDQQYLNDLHDEYFFAISEQEFDVAMLNAHDSIHILEEVLGHREDRTTIWFDYKERAGLLAKPFDRSLLKYAVTEIPRGTVSIQSHDLGKEPIVYFRDGEPADLNKLCRISKPWQVLYPIMNINLKHKNSYEKFIHSGEQEKFSTWFAPFKQQWCEYWNINDWNPKEMFSYIPIGHVNCIEELESRFLVENYPVRLKIL